MALEHGLTAELLPLSNPLVTAEQLSTTSSQLDGLSPDLEASVRYAGCCLTQQAGILLRLPQDVIAQAIVTFTRFYTGSEAGSFAVHAAQDISAACLFLAAKLSPFPVSPRSTIAVYRFLLSHSSRLSTDVKKPWSDPPTSEEIDAAFLSEGAYFSERQTLHLHESLILRSLSFRTTVHLPYHLALTYLQTLGTLPAPPTSKSRELALRAIQHLNTALLSPQLLYLTHQPHALAVASVYLAARECGVRLVEGEWWEVFDVDREELGFLVMSLRSCEAWMMQEQDRWRGRESSLLRVDSLAEEIRGRKGADSV